MLEHHTIDHPFSFYGFMVRFSLLLYYFVLYFSLKESKNLDATNLVYLRKSQTDGMNQ